ncbi:LSU ribosomal protein L25p [hydrothermal vent metagenome]|uniref:LSU ribosomal protein L25p n=1 Tax=hydrothermal vent metagenome TaxID=652676 RepID=A0A3B0ULC4_9ZZZZ
MADERLTIDAESRTVVGKKVKRLRWDGVIPAVIYGNGEPATIQLDNRILLRVLRKAGSTTLIDISLAGQTRTVLAREIQQHLTRGDLIHVDFLEVDMKVKIKTEIPLVLINQSVPTVDGLGTDVLSTQSVEIEALPDDLVAEIEVDASQITSPEVVVIISDLPIPSGVLILTEGDRVAARFVYTRLETEEEDDEEEFEATPDSVEIIEKGKEEEDEE